MEKLEKINFGNADGKKEARRSNFEALFYDNDGYFEKLSDPDRFLIIGRKGTGKTLLLEFFKKTMRKKEHTFVGSADVSDFLSVKLHNFDEKEINLEEMTIFWQYFLLKEFTHLILNNEKAIQRMMSKSFKDLKKLDRKLQTTLQTITASESDEFSLGADLEKGGIGGNVQAKGNETRVMVPEKYYEEFTQLMDKVNSFINSTNYSYYLTMDDIDELNSKVKDKETFYYLTIAFINALNKINDGLWTEKQNGKVIATLRTDLLDELNIRSDNLSKIIFDCQISINWFSSLDREDNPLMKMVLHKVRASIKEYQEVSDKKLFDKLFPSSPRGVNGFVDYLLKKSFGRPRDIVYFLRMYVQIFHEDRYFDYKNLNKCVPQYASFFYQDLENEINVLSNRSEVLSLLDLIQRQKVKNFNFEMVHKYYEENKDEFPEIKSLKNGLNSLFTLGAIGMVFYQKGKLNIYEFSYREGTASKLDFNTDFVVHDAIKEHLSLV